MPKLIARLRNISQQASTAAYYFQLLAQQPLQAIQKLDNIKKKSQMRLPGTPWPSPKPFTQDVNNTLEYFGKLLRNLQQEKAWLSEIAGTVRDQNIKNIANNASQAISTFLQNANIMNAFGHTRNNPEVIRQSGPVISQGLRTLSSSMDRVMGGIESALPQLSSAEPAAGTPADGTPAAGTPAEEGKSSVEPIQAKEVGLSEGIVDLNNLEKYDVNALNVIMNLVRVVHDRKAREFKKTQGQDVNATPAVGKGKANVTQSSSIKRNIK